MMFSLALFRLIIIYRLYWTYICDNISHGVIELKDKSNNGSVVFLRCSKLYYKNYEK